MKESTVSVLPTPEFRALSMVLSAWLSTQSPKNRNDFAINLLRTVRDAEAEEITEDDAAQANAWVRALVAEIVGTPKAA